MRLLARALRATDLYEADLAPLGVLAVLTEIKLLHPAETVDAWEKAFAALDARTTEEREFWDEQVRRVKPVFALLREPSDRANDSAVDAQ